MYTTWLLVIEFIKSLIKLLYSLPFTPVVCEMSVLIDVTPSVHEKFKNYKESSTFRDKTDAELLEYFLDSFEVITCIGKFASLSWSLHVSYQSIFKNWFYRSFLKSFHLSI